MQPTHPGWYWDPRGMPGLFRWWDGEGWTEHVSVVRTAGAPQAASSASPGPDGRFHGGGLSFPVLPEPWRWCPDYPHLEDAIGQQVVVGHTPRGEYVGAVFIGGVPDELLGADLDATGTAFASAMLDTFYPAEVPHERPEPETGVLDDRACWRLVVPLDVRDDHLGFAREDAVFVLVDLPGRPGVLYASLPHVEDVPMPSAVELVADLRVG